MSQKPYTPSKKILKKYAELLVNFALNSGKGMKKGDVVRILGWESAKSLVMACVEAVTDAGGYPILNYLPDESVRHGATPYFLQHGSKKQLSFTPHNYFKGIIADSDHELLILSYASLDTMKHVPAQHMAWYQEATSGPYYRDYRTPKELAGKLSWTLALYGTPAMAEAAGLTLKEYWQQIIKACYLDKKDPIAEHKILYKEIERVRRKLTSLDIEKLHILGNDVDLWISVGQDRKWLAGSGHNVPTFEVFISPDWRGTEGWIRFSEPLYYNQQKIEGIHLEFKKGLLSKASAKKNNKTLQAMIEIKNGNKIGEFSLTDRRISRITKNMANTLYDENRGGAYGNTHIALGAAYADSYSKDPSKLTPTQKEKLGFNISSLHEDMVSTTDRTVTAYLKNGKEKIIYQKGEFTI
ncbi:aminopeptidase [Candidatus Nomurabacteria bacterium]|nr:aminopeptidase [Candidatus Nomurabacteria bacterium]